MISAHEKKGSVLIISLLIIMSLAGMILDLSDESVTSLTLNGFSRDAYMARQVARAGVQVALDRLASDSDLEVDSLQEDWAGFGVLPLPDGFGEGVGLSGRIIDESGKVNVNALINEKGEIDETKQARLARLFRALGLGEEKTAPILDWLDRDEIERMNGAESYYYQSLKDPYSCANGPFMSIGQIFMVKGIQTLWDSSSKMDIRDYLTIYSDGKININTAPPEALCSLGDNFDQAISDAIVDYRKANVFRAPEDLKKVPGMSDALYSGVSQWVTVKSSAFSIEMEGVVAGVRSEVHAVAVRENKRVKLVYWKGQ